MRLKVVEEANTQARGEFKASFASSVDELASNMDAYEAGHVEGCRNIQEKLKEQLSIRGENISSLGLALHKLVADQVKVFGEVELNNLSFGCTMRLQHPEFIILE